MIQRRKLKCDSDEKVCIYKYSKKKKRQHFLQQVYCRRNQSAGNAAEDIKDEPRDIVLG